VANSAVLVRHTPKRGSRLAARHRRLSPKKIDAACLAWRSAEKGRTLKTLAVQVETEERTLWNWRHGVTSPDGNELVRLLDTLGKRLDDLTE